MSSILGANLLNNPIALTIIIASIVIVAVAIILYFFVFRKKVKAKVADNQVKREQKAVKTAKSQALAGDVFKEEEAKEDRKLSDDELEAFEKKFNAVANTKKAGSENARNFGSQLDIAKPEKEEKEPDVPDTNVGFNVMNQFGNKKK